MCLKQGGVESSRATAEQPSPSTGGFYAPSALPSIFLSTGLTTSSSSHLGGLYISSDELNRGTAQLLLLMYGTDGLAEHARSLADSQIPRRDWLAPYFPL